MLVALCNTKQETIQKIAHDNEILIVVDEITSGWRLTDGGVYKINGLNPNPGAWFDYKGERLKVWKAEISNQSGNVGEILDEKLTIACRKKSIKILVIQKEGKSRQAVEQFLLGNKIKKGENLA